MLEEGDHLATVGTPDDVLYVVYGRCYARLLDHMSLGGWVALHAGIVRIHDRRALVIGEKGAGKTTLLLRLLYDGHTVEGDEVVFTRGGAAISQPRNFHVKPPTRDLIPELAPIWSSLPTTAMSDGLVIRAFDPAAVGFPWSVSEAPIDAVFVLRPAHGSPGSCRGTSSVHGIAAAVGNALPTGLASSRVVQACATLLGRRAGPRARGRGCRRHGVARGRSHSCRALPTGDREIAMMLRSYEEVDRGRSR